MVVQSAEHFTRFTTNYCLKTQQEHNSTDNICYLKYICNPTYRDRHHNILYKIRHFWAVCRCTLQKSLQSIQNRCLDIIEIPRTSLPALEDRCKVATKREVERIVNDITTQIKYFSQSQIPAAAIAQYLNQVLQRYRSPTQRHTNSLLSRAARLLLLIYYIISTYLHLIAITLSQKKAKSQIGINQPCDLHLRILII